MFLKRFSSGKIVYIFAKLFEKFKEDMKDIQNLALSNKNNQIKGVISNKFDEFEKERQEQKKVIEELRGGVFSLNKN